MSIGQYNNCPKMTLDFPAWAGGFARELQKLRSSTGAGLHQWEALFGRWIAPHWLSQQDEGAHSRTRLWNLRLVFWTFLWQVAHTGSACREAIRQAQCLCRLTSRPIPPDETSPFCQARAHLPLERLEQIHDGIVADTQAAIARKDLWCGHRVQVVDASTVTLADTPENQAAYPQQSVQKPGCGFPIMRLIGLFSLATGLFGGWALGTWLQHEIVLFQRLWDYLRAGEVLLGDRGFGTWPILAQCLARGVHGVFRVHGGRKVDWRCGRRLGPDQRLVQWTKPRLRPAYLSEEQWKQLPELLTLRLVRVRVSERGFRTRRLLLVTTLLDGVKYPPSALAQLYRRRWDMELTLRHLKTTLQMEHLSCKTPGNVERELRLHLLVHNLVRRLMFEAARRANRCLSRISFAGTLAAARCFAEALLQARTRRQKHQLIEELYRILAEDLVPDRPGRREPRAHKRRPKPFPLLTCHRSRFREIPHQSRYRIGSPCHPKPFRNS
jgi:hypothetical protein